MKTWSFGPAVSSIATAALSLALSLAQTLAVIAGALWPAHLMCQAAMAQERTRSIADVSDFGAVPDDGRDDSLSIQAAIDTSRPGTTIRFGAGTFDVSRPIRLRSFQRYVGGGATVLKRIGAGAAPLMIIEGRRGIAISGITFRGGGIALSQTTRNIVINANRFEAIYDKGAAFGDETAIFIAGPLQGGTIKANTFTDIGLRKGRPGSVHANAILAYHLNTTEIIDNSFADVYQAMTLQFEGRPGTGRGVKVAGNEIVRPWRMGIEAQGNGTNGALFERNFVRSARGGGAAIGMSIVLNQGVATVVRDNVVVSDASYSGPCASMGIEAAGIATIVTGNRVAGHWCASIGIYADEVQYAIVTGNITCGHAAHDHGPPIDLYHKAGRSVVARNRAWKDCPASFPDSIKAARAAQWRLR